MYKIFACITSVIILFQIGCKGNNDVLATFNGGEIKREELYKSLENRKLDKNFVLKSKAAQQVELKQIALQKLTYLEAVNAGYEKTEASKILLEYLKNDFISKEYLARKSAHLPYKEEAARVRMIKLPIDDHKTTKNIKMKLSDKEMRDRIGKQALLAKTIIRSLAEKKNFEELAGKHSIDPSKKNGGDIGYIVQGMREPEFVKAALSLKAGEFSREPVMTKNAVYVLKVEDRAILTKENIESVIAGKKNAETVKFQLMTNAARTFEQNLVKAADVKDFIRDPRLSGRERVLFVIGEEKYTVDELESILNHLIKMVSASGKKVEPMDANRKKEEARKIFIQKLVVREALKGGFDKTPEFQNDLKRFQDAFISGKYKNEVIGKDITVTEEEIKREYDDSKEEDFSRPSKRGGKGGKRLIPYNQVRDKIRTMIYTRKLNKATESWEEQTLKKYNFSVNKSKLEGK